MSNWKVSKERAEILEHPNADSLVILKAGEFQLVAGLANGYNDGDTIIVMPAGTLIHNEGLRQEEEKYLTGPKKNRVKSISLRGEVSQGATFPISLLRDFYDERTADLVEAAPIGEDISELLNMTKYTPPIPSELQGQIKGIRLYGAKNELETELFRADCVQWGAFSKYFDEEEEVIITEKLHGSQCNYVFTVDMDGDITETVTSKGLLKNGFSILEAEGNAYWQGVRNSNLRDICKNLYQTILDYPYGVKFSEDYPEHNLGAFKEMIIHVVGELVPVQKGFTYGQDKPVIKVFDVIVDEEHMRPEEFPWVPVLYEGPLDDVDVYELAKGKETVSGKELHIREGCVVAPAKFRTNSKGVPLTLKVINPKYSAKETGEELS